MFLKSRKLIASVLLLEGEYLAPPPIVEDLPQPPGNPSELNFHFHGFEKQVHFPHEKVQYSQKSGRQKAKERHNLKLSTPNGGRKYIYAGRR